MCTSCISIAVSSFLARMASSLGLYLLRLVTACWVVGAGSPLECAGRGLSSLAQLVALRTRTMAPMNSRIELCMVFLFAWIGWEKHIDNENDSQSAITSDGAAQCRNNLQLARPAPIPLARYSAGPSTREVV